MTDRVSEELGREVSDDELKLWREAKAEAERSPYEYVRMTHVGTTRCGLHETRCRQIVRTWENDGLVITGQTPNTAKFTEYGKRLDR